MNCRKCKNEIPDGSIYCNWCGEKQIKDRKKKDEIKVPKPRQLPSGKWFIQLRAEGQSVTEDTEALCIAKARAIRAGFVEQRKRLPEITIGSALDEYISSRSNIISPSTLRTYRHIRKYRFASLMSIKIKNATLMDFQKAVNEEAANIGPKTLHNAWGLLKSAISSLTTVDLTGISIPTKPKSKVNVYDIDDLQKLFSAVEGDDVEIAVLLAACLGLRRSEILGLTYEAIDREAQTIHISQARVPNDRNELVLKGTKTEKSTRTLPCPKFILDKIPEGTGYIYNGHKQNYLLERLKRICVANGLPNITLHGLRHTNASIMLALNIPDKYAMERGGWSNNQTMKNIYQHTIASERVKSDNVINNFFEELSGGQTQNFTNRITNDI